MMTRVRSALLLTAVLVASLVAPMGAQRVVRAGGSVPPPRPVKHVDPVYPEDAKAAGVSGVVIMEIEVGTRGSVVDAKILRSIPLLDQAALDAVYQWQYEPTTLDGEPVDVLLTVTVNFSLD
jgi:protein TonB